MDKGIEELRAREASQRARGLHALADKTAAVIAGLVAMRAARSPSGVPLD